MDTDRYDYEFDTRVRESGDNERNGMTTEKRQTFENVAALEADLRGFTGTDGYYRHPLGLCLTDGITAMANRAGAWWFLDIIGSYQASTVVVPSAVSGATGRGAQVRELPFQLWRIDATEGHGRVTMREDSGEPPVVAQDVEFTDFPSGTFEVYCIDGVVMLKGEY